MIDILYVENKFLFLDPNSLDPSYDVQLLEMDLNDWPLLVCFE